MTKSEHKYLMESDEESIRLDLKTDPSLVEEQALPPGEAGGKGVTDVVDDGGARPLSRGDNSENGRIALVGLIVEDHGIESRLAMLRYG